ncbi:MULTISPECIES: dTDP-4-dehydrorhamnose reductase [Spongiibacter]|uniref:dTDP-4-dehydrorhamnose reductase n=1 Tax=Spongiibacter TaxID=630749 RepID=UPI000C3CAD84|nr:MULTISPECIES: dTDP-4-dehydrorhamnose reductase [Spongiibacter]MAY38117.1 dTDP-4-dehydrorhamnose reductase [Spongiibacter sp.]MBI59387.1 dTDP-4-dehydrorhamnose reductase [Spongiibacter sp.]
MKVLLTGANGQVGRCTQDVYGGSGHELKALGRDALDISDAAAVAQTVKAFCPDVIINAAAYTAVDKAESEPELAYAINVAGPANLADAAAEVNALLIHISTDYVFDGTAHVPYFEGDETNPQGVYGQTKLDGEREVQRRCDRHIILRTAWVFSEYGNNFVKTMLRLGKERSELGVVADQIGSPTYAGDIAKACYVIAEQVKEGSFCSGIYHFAGDEAVSWHAFASEIFQEASNSGMLSTKPIVNAITTADYPTPAARPAYSVMTSEKLMKDFSVPACDWKSALLAVLPKIS